MCVEKFVKLLYLGDRACKGFIIDTWNTKISINIDTISKVNQETGQWDFNSKDDIADGYIVLDKVKSFEFSPPGFLPNDMIYKVVCKPILNNLYAFEFHLSSVNEGGSYTDVVFKVVAGDAYLSDPKNGVEIIRWY